MSRPSAGDHDPDGANKALAEVVPVGGTHEVACAVVVAHLDAVMGLPARVGPFIPAADLAPAGRRGQHDAALLTRRLGEHRPPNLIRVGVTEVDLSLPVFSYVYGEADVGGGVAMVSTYRLRGGAAPPALLYERLAKVACHEAGHALGLRHCSRPRCLMRFAGRLDALDDIVLGFCADCAAALAAGRDRLAAGQLLRRDLRP